MEMSSFIQYIKKQKGVAILVLVFALGVIFLTLGSLDRGETAQTPSLESKVSELCSSIDGVGDCRAVIYYGSGDNETRVESVVVVCEGADSVEVRKNIIETLSSLFGIGTNRVRIEKMATGE